MSDPVPGNSLFRISLECIRDVGHSRLDQWRCFEILGSFCLAILLIDVAQFENVAIQFVDADPFDEISAWSFAYPIEIPVRAINFKFPHIRSEFSAAACPCHRE